MHRDETGARWLILQHRAHWSHHGDTWGVPGGARNHGETAEEAALREAHEEAHLDLGAIEVIRTHVDDHGGWSYETVLCHSDRLLDASPRGAETIDIRWIRESELGEMTLHPGLATTLPLLLALA